MLVTLTAAVKLHASCTSTRCSDRACVKDQTMGNPWWSVKRLSLQNLYHLKYFSEEEEGEEEGY